jgi:hypothetical protein
VILSAGVAKSPHILMLSGVGPAAHLESHGIRVKVDLPGVGQNYVERPRSVLAFASTQVRAISAVVLAPQSRLTHGNATHGNTDRPGHDCGRLLRGSVQPVAEHVRGSTPFLFVFCVGIDGERKNTHPFCVGHSTRGKGPLTKGSSGGKATLSFPGDTPGLNFDFHVLPLVWWCVRRSWLT